ncbi:MAG: M48 family metallopeptidase [Phycisphaerales bacterium]
MILLIGVVVLVAGGARGAIEPAMTVFVPEGRAQAWWVVAGVWAAVSLVSSVAHLVCWWSGRAMDRTGSARAVRGAFAASGAGRWACLLVFCAGVLVFGLLDAVRVLVGGDVVVLDEALALLPLLVALAWSWRAIAPIDQRLRESMVMPALQRGNTPPQIVGAWSFVAEQVRHQLLILLVPLGAITVWTELADRVFPGADGSGAGTWVHMSGAVCVVVLMPIALRAIWRTVRIEDGALRDRLLSVCHRHGVRVSDVLLWRTRSGMANAAVIGFVPWIRYVLLSDGLLERLPDAEVEAVMAHEIGHIRRRHILWMGGFLVCSMFILWGGASMLLERVLIDEARTSAAIVADERAERRLVRAQETGGGASGLFEAFAAFREASEARVAVNEAIERDNARREVAAFAGLLAALPLVVLGFGFVSRRIERQADAFAAQHLSGLGGEDGAHGSVAVGDGDPEGPDGAGAEPDGVRRIGAEAALTMSAALARVAHANGMELRRWGFRHGSIAERRRHLSTLVGRPIDALPIDRTVGRIKWVTIAMVGAVVAMFVLM